MAKTIIFKPHANLSYDKKILEYIKLFKFVFVFESTSFDRLSFEDLTKVEDFKKKVFFTIGQFLSC
jgi:hypothetical protein